MSIRGELVLSDLQRTRQEAERALQSAREAFMKEHFGDRPESPDAYEPQLPADLPMQVTIRKDHPTYRKFAELAHKRGLSQGEFNEFLGEFVQASMGGMPNVEQQLDRLDNGAARQAAATQFLRTEVSSRKDGIVEALLSTADGVVFVEDLMKRFQSVVNQLPQGTFSKTSDEVKAEIKELDDQIDKLREGRERTDLMEKRSALYRRLYPGQRTFGLG